MRHAMHETDDADGFEIAGIGGGQGGGSHGKDRVKR